MESPLKVITCDAPDCGSYYQAHPTAQNIPRELKLRGWKIVETNGTTKHYCSTHVDVVPDSVLKRASDVPV